MNNVSVIVVNWNAGDLLLRCLAALEEQADPCREVIVVDNDSTDNSISAVGNHFPHVRIIRQAITRGLPEEATSGCTARLANGEHFSTQMLSRNRTG